MIPDLSPFELKLSPPLDQVLEQLAGSSFDKAQVIIVTKMLLVTMEAARHQARDEMRQEMAAMRGDYGRLIIEAVEATEKKIFARLAQEKADEEEKKRARRERAAVRRQEREAAKAAASYEGGIQAGLFDDEESVLPQRRAVVDEQPVVSPRSGFQPSPPDLPVPVRAAPSPPDLPVPVRAMPSPPLVTGGIANAFEENAEYKALMAQWESQAKANAPQKPVGSPLAAVKSLGEAMVASLKKDQEAVRCEAPNRERNHMAVSGDVGLIEQSLDEEVVGLGVTLAAGGRGW